MRRAAVIVGVVLGAAALAPAGASAATTIFSEDGEGAVDAKWAVNEPGSGIQPWQKSDSDAEKLRGNQAHGGSTSFWTGMSPNDWPPVPTTAGPGTVATGESLLTMKQTLLIPADGQSTLEYWSLWQNEGDDSGSAEVAIADDGKPGKFKKIKSETVANTAAGDTDPYGCDPTHPEITMQEAFKKVTAPLAAYAGHKIVLRFNMTYGTENRPVTQPCGWYLDDIAITTTGTPGNAGASAGPGASAAPAAAARPTVKLGAAKLKGRRATLSVAIGGGSLRNVKVTLKARGKAVGTGRAATLEPGTRTIALKLRRKLKKGAYAVVLTGTAADGSRITSAGRVRAR
jgi:hypothetical protein